jgi:hypothetical protein
MIVNVAGLRNVLNDWIETDDNIADYEFRRLDFDLLSITSCVDIDEDNGHVIFSKAHGHTNDCLTAYDILSIIDTTNTNIDNFKLCQMGTGGITLCRYIELLRNLVVIC